MAMMFEHRTSLGDLLPQHDRSPLAVRLSDGSVNNAYTMKLLNKSATAHALELKAEGADVTMAVIGSEAGNLVTVPVDGSESIRVTLRMAHPQNADVRFVARDVTGKDVLSTVDRFVIQCRFRTLRWVALARHVPVYPPSNMSAQAGDSAYASHGSRANGLLSRWSSGPISSSRRHRTA